MRSLRARACAPAVVAVVLLPLLRVGGEVEHRAGGVRRDDRVEAAVLDEQAAPARPRDEMTRVEAVERVEVRVVEIGKPAHPARDPRPRGREYDKVETLVDPREDRTLGGAGTVTVEAEPPCRVA